MTTHTVGDCEDEIGTHTADLEAIGRLIEAAADDRTGAMSPKTWARIGWMIQRLAQKATDLYLQENKPKAVQSGGAK